MDVVRDRVGSCIVELAMFDTANSESRFNPDSKSDFTIVTCNTTNLREESG